MINEKLKRQLKAALPPPKLREFFQLIENKRQAMRPVVRKLRQART